MDSLTQITFGAACGEAVLGHKVGRRAMFWGAFLGTLPDLDILIPLGGPVDDFVYHRGFSHSLFLLALLSPLMAWLITKIHPATKKHFKGWLLLTFLVLETSVLLDLFTVYGTQILWPFDNTPLAWPIFFIIDPLFTLPVLLGALAALVLKRSSSLGHQLNMIGLVLSMAYLIWAFGAREFVEYRVRDKLARQHVPYTHLISTPAPFTTFLWRIVGIDKDQYFETYFSLFDGHTPLFVNHYPRNLELMNRLEEHPPIVKLRWFTKGYYAFAKAGEHIVMTDLRMGLEPDYVFRFKVAKIGNPNPIPVKDERLKTRPDLRRLDCVWKRIWNSIPTSISKSK
ncbi:MAG: metal-dependent hydrolase [Desulfobacterales bacterium]